MMRNALKKLWGHAASILAAAVCLTASGVLSASADDYVPPYTFTPAQTLALYGDTIEGDYLKTDGTWNACTWQYYGTVRNCNLTSYGYESGQSNASWDFRGGQPSGYTSWGDFIGDNFNNPDNAHLVYYCPVASLSGIDTTIPIDNVCLHITPSIEIAGIKFYSQTFGISKPAPTLPYNSADIDWTPPVNLGYLSTTVTGRTTPAISYTRGWTMFDSVNRSWGWYRTRYLQNDEYGSKQAVQPVYYNLIRTYVDVLVNGVQTPFNVQSQTLNYSAVASYPITSGGGGQGYFLMVGCPTVTDGYVIPSTDTDLTLSEINANTGKIVTQLDAVLAKLDTIISKMQTLSPSLVPAATVPRSLDSIYSGIETGAPSQSEINAGIGGAAVVPFSGILGASGLGATFGLLVGLACAGWVITRGRN